MKKSFALLLMASALIFGTAATPLSTATETVPAKSIMGVWAHEMAADPYELDLLIFDDGNYAIFSSYANTEYSEVGKWRLDGNRLTLTKYYGDGDYTMNEDGSYSRLKSAKRDGYECSYEIDGQTMTSGGDVFLKTTFAEEVASDIEMPWWSKENFEASQKCVSSIMK